MMQFIPETPQSIFGRPFVKRFALYTIGPLSVLSVTLVHCGQTIGRIKIELGMQVGIGLGHIVSDGDPAPPPQRGTASNFWPISVVVRRLDVSGYHLVRK